MKKYVDIDKIEKMKEAGVILSKILKEISLMAKAGTSLLDIDNRAEELCKQNNVTPAFKNYEGFPKSVCVGVNNVVVHGIPDEYVLQEGDIVSLDMGIKYKDVYSDCALTVAVGKISDSAKKLIEATRLAVLRAIKEAKPGKTVGDLGYAMQSTVEAQGFSVVREMTGHGIGYHLHEEPFIPGYGNKNSGEKLYEGQTLAIEAIINEGKPGIYISREDGWTSTTKDGKLSALFEHTVVVGKEPLALTQW
jgi:methionyl aminopeptidase